MFYRMQTYKELNSSIVLRIFPSLISKQINDWINFQVINFQVIFKSFSSHFKSFSSHFQVIFKSFSSHFQVINFQVKRSFQMEI